MRRLAVVAALLACAGCGVPVDSSPTALDPSAAPFRAYVPSPAPVPVGDSTATLYFVRGGLLEAVRRPIDAPSSPREVLGQLLDGPTGAELSSGLTTALPATVTVDRLRIVGDVVLVTLGGLSQEEAVRGDQLTAFAQVVATLDDVAGIEGVRFRTPDGPLQVPRGDGSLAGGALDRSDYEQLLGGPA